MLDVRKPFDQKLHDECDEPARRAVKDIFLSYNDIKLDDNPDIYGIDLVRYDQAGNIIYGVEVERRFNWNGMKFPFETLHIPYRKLKFAALPYQTYFVAVNNDLSWAMILDLALIKGEATVVVQNRFVADGEEFFNVPTTKCWVVDVPVMPVVTDKPLSLGDFM